MSVLSPRIGATLPRLVHGPVRDIVTSALRLGPLPAHIALVMDGNRRLARREGIQTLRGHELGFEALKGLLAFFLKLGIAHITVYAFAIDNFQRSADEVEGLMTLAKDKLLELGQKGELLQRYGVRVYIIGHRELLRPDVQEACERLEQMTAHNTAGSLNVCFPYASTDEIAHATRTCIDHGSDDTITPAALESALYTSRSDGFGAPDLLIRTSGARRLSDFLLWQATSSHTSIHFLPRMWPEIGVADLLPILLSWQAHAVLRRIGLVA